MKTLKIALAITTACALPLAAQAQEVTLRLSHWVPATIAPGKGIEMWAKSVEADSEGRIAIQIFPAQQIGAAPDHYDMARDGIADITWVNPGYTAGRFPIFSLIEVPFQVSDSVPGAKAIHEWYQAYAPSEMSDVKFCLVHPHGAGALHSKEQIRVPGDIAGKNIRPAHATMARFVSQLGGGPVQVPAPEAREAVARGTADAVTFPWGAMYDFNLSGETTHHLDMPFYMSGQILVINPDSYAGLSAENKAVIDAHCTPEWSEKMAANWAADDMAARDRLRADPKQTFYEPSEADVAAWREAGQGVLKAWMEEIGGKGQDAQAIYDAYVGSLESNGARY
ncbi:MAG: TRAP transporter substrate-binding protein [Pseudodonghicola sp.]